jgi:hypothetical protein
VLGLSPGATLRQVHKSYKRLVLQHHPDRTAGDPNSLKSFCEATEAYSTLKRAFALREVSKSAGPCPRCERIKELFRGLDGKKYCADCLLTKRRKYLPLPTYEQMRCIGVIGLQSVAVYCTIVSTVLASWQHAAFGMGSVMLALGWLAIDLYRADVIER